MLDKERLTSIFDDLGTPDTGRKIVREARINAPVREVKSNGSNVNTILASRKMGCGIATESRHLEFAAAFQHEHDPYVLEFYPQPCTLRLELFNEAADDFRSIHHTPDFLVLRGNSITLEEWKPDEALTRLAQKQPYRYQRDEDGNWRAPQIEHQLAQWGISYRIYTDLSISRRRVENLLHLADYLHPTASPCDPEQLRRLDSALQNEGMLYLADLTSQPYSFDIDFLFKAVADRLVVTDLDHEDLTNQRACRLYRDETYLQFIKAQYSHTDALGTQSFSLVLETGTRFRYDGQLLEIALVGEDDVICRADKGNTIPLSRNWLIQAHEAKQIEVAHNEGDGPVQDLARFTEDQLKLALKRQAILEAPSTIVSERTLRDWTKRTATAIANGTNPIVALVPNTAARGNRTARLSNEQEALLEQMIKKRWKTSEAINYRTLHKWVTEAFEQAGLKAPSYPTVIARVKAQSDNRDVRIRHGKRRAYHEGDFVDVLYADTPTHGSRALQYVHIDHTQTDIELISQRTGKPLGRPWLSLAVDAFSRRVVGFYMTFDPPSYVSVMMIMRDIVRRFQRLPEMIVVDNGRDLTSGAFQSFLQVMGVHLRLRPAGQPRAGAVMERLFGTAHSQYIHNLAGNTKATKQVRMTTGSHLPVNLAQWTLDCLYHGLTYWATQYYDTEPHSSLGCSPREMFERSLAQSGYRKHRHILWNQDFLIATCPPADRGAMRQVNNQRGVKVHDQYYWNPAFRNPKVATKKLPVRYDPWDASTVYVRLNDQWVAAKCRNLSGLGQLTEVERRAITEEYYRQSGKAPNDPLASNRLREFLQVLTPEGALATALDRQQENKGLYNSLGLSAIQPVSPIRDWTLLESTPFISTDDDTDLGQAEDPANFGETDDTPYLPESLPPFDTF